MYTLLRRLGRVRCLRVIYSIDVCVYVALFSSVIKPYTMLSRPEARAHSALEVALVPDSGLCTDIEHTVKARMAAGCSLLCCLKVDGKLMLSDVSEPGASLHVPEDSYTE